MDLVFRVIYAAHAPGTHHKLALDALELFEGPDAERWQRLLLKHVQPFMVGAKAPDNEFKDFKNHVLHPRDDYWGGAPATARIWYRKLVDLLKSENWAEAAHAAGVLSHYVTDAVHPFHTGQSEAENSIHRALEWSTAKSYAELRQIGKGRPRPEIRVPGGQDWLEEMVRQGAAHANSHYEKLIAHYDINKGVVDPPAGLDAVAQRILAELVRYASGQFAAIAQEAFREAGVTPPEVSLTLDAVLATIQIPIKRLVKRMADASERRLIERMYDELRETGTVEFTLPEDDRIVRDLHAKEVLDKRSAERPAPSARSPHAERRTSEPESALSLTSVPSIGARPKPAASSPTAMPSLVGSLEQAMAQEAQAADKSVRDAASAAPQPNAGTARAPARDAIAPRANSERGGRAPRLGGDDPIVDAPSIGPRMSARLEPIGIVTVTDLLDADATDVATRLEVSYVDASTIADWQAQARLACTVPDLTGTGAQLFVGAGYRAAEAIGDTDPDKICADILRFAGTSAGQRILRNGPPPDISRIKLWAEAARSLKAA